jgi:CheY-like chemotaxis protein
MSREVQEKAFEPFFTTKPVGQGTGLGLSMVYGTIKQSGGYVYIDSREGEGTTVHILLPVVEGQEPAIIDSDMVPEGSSMLQGQGRMVLVVEDEVLVLHLVNNFLEKLGFRVKSFVDPVEALSFLEACPEDELPELLLTDLVLPRMNGREMAEKALEMAPDLKILYMSGYSAEMISKHGILPGDTKFLQKPFTLAQFSQKMKQILDEEDGGA